MPGLMSFLSPSDRREPNHMSLRKASLAIDIAIVGRSISGLACAYSLARHGHRVHVFERSTTEPTYSAGIRVPPNLDKLLHAWGLDEKMEQALATSRSDFYHQDNVHQGFMLWQPDVLREAGGDFCTMHWDELYQILLDLAVSAGTGITLGASVVDLVLDNSQRPVLTFADGSNRTFDVVVGADGMKSTIRNFVNESLEPRRGFSESDSHITVYTVVVPLEQLMKDPDWREKVDGAKGQFTLWTSESRWIIGYPVRQGKEYCLHATWHGAFSTDDNFDDWCDLVPTSSIDFSGCHPMIQRLYALVPEAMRSKYQNVHVEDWVDETGRVTLVGDAAHPTIPFTIHGQSLAVEDAVVLGTLFSRLSRWDQIPQLLDGFQELRQERCQFVHATEIATAHMLSLPPGTERDERDENNRLTLQASQEEWDEAQLESQWEGIAAVFGYMAREAAEEWWYKWGMLDHRTSVFDVMDLGMEMQVHQVRDDSGDSE